MANSNRKKQIEDLIAQISAEFLEVESNRTTLITITRAEASTNLAQITLYCTILPDTQEEFALNFLKRKRALLREYIKKNSKLRRIPFVDFVIDKGEKQRQLLDEISYADKQRKH